MKPNYTFEYTDTFGGEPNYCWVRRGKFYADNNKQAVRKAKKFLGLDGVKCDRGCQTTDFGITLVPRNSCTILFVDHLEEVNADYFPDAI
jgi:hypothetical protein